MDMTNRRGEGHYRAKLSVGDVLAIRADTRTQRTIAEEYGVSSTLVAHIKLRKRWAHVEPSEALEAVGRLRGAAHGRARLTEADVVSIRSDGRAAGFLAEMYGVSPANIRLILSRKTWRHI